MSNFRTVLPIEKANFSIDYQSCILCIGSCFTENIGQLLHQYKFSILLNPFGILYNPISIKKNLEFLLSKDVFKREDLFFNNELWHSFDYHGSFSHPNQKEILAHINTTLINARQFLQKTNRLILTFGTANVFIKKSTGKVVANCHKVSNTEFTKQRLSINKIVSELFPVLKQLKKLNPCLEIIFTVSPVRHIKDGLLENKRSKATLLLAIEGLTEKLPFTHYFPAYELVVDDLRDYRFFEKDMVHPNESAIQYIWEKFQQKYFSSKTALIIEKIKKIVIASQHRPYHSQISTHQKFVNKQLEKIDEVERAFSNIQMTTEREIFLAQLNK